MCAVSGTLYSRRAKDRDTGPVACPMSREARPGQLGRDRTQGEVGVLTGLWGLAGRHSGNGRPPDRMDRARGAAPMGRGWAVDLEPTLKSAGCRGSWGPRPSGPPLTRRPRRPRRAFWTLPMALRGSAGEGTSLGHFGGQPRAEGGPQGVGVGRRARRGDDGGHHPLAEVGVGHPHHRGLGHAGPLQQRGLDLGGVDIEPAGDDEILAAAHEVDVAVGISEAEVAAAQPAALQRRGRRVGAVEVGRDDAGAPVEELPDRVPGDHRAGLGVPDLGLGAGHVEAHRPRPALAVQRVGQHDPHLGHAVALQHPVAEARRDVLVHPGRQGRRARREQPHGREVRPHLRGEAQQAVVVGGHAHEDGAAAAFEHAQGRGGLEAPHPGGAGAA